MHFICQLIAKISYYPHPFSALCRRLMTLRNEAFETIVGKRENASKQHFLLFPPCFLSYERQILRFNLSSANDLYFVKVNSVCFF